MAESAMTVKRATGDTGPLLVAIAVGGAVALSLGVYGRIGGPHSHLRLGRDRHRDARPGWIGNVQRPDGAGLDSGPKRRNEEPKQRTRSRRP